MEHVSYQTAAIVRKNTSIIYLSRYFNIYTIYTRKKKKKKRPVVERPTLVRITSFSASYLLSCGWMFCKAVRITTKKPRNGVPICIINLTEMYGEIEKFHNIPQTLVKLQIKHFTTRYYYIICFIN